jgi:hypothetical protein
MRNRSPAGSIFGLTYLLKTFGVGSGPIDWSKAGTAMVPRSLKVKLTAGKPFVAQTAAASGTAA